MKKLTLLLSAVATALSVQATPINVAFTDDPLAYTGPLVVGGPGDPWTAFSAAAGVPQSIGGGLTLTASGPGYGYYDTNIPLLPPTAVTREYLYSEGTLTLAIGGFNPFLTYDFYFVANLDDYFDGGARSVTAIGGTTVGPVSITNNSSITTLAEGTNWIRLLNVQPTPTGTISLTVGIDAGVTALQIVPIPEPSAYAALLGLGALVWVARRRRTRC